MARSASRPRGRVRLALLAAGVIALTGVLVRTSATWTDQFRAGTEAPGGGPLSSSSFGIEQRAVGPDGSAGTWVGGGSVDPVSELPFGRAASRMSPGDQVYAGLQIRARDGSLRGWVHVDSPTLPSGADSGQLSVPYLRDALRIRIVAVPVPRAASPSCSALTFSDPGATTIADGPLVAGDRSASVPLPAAGGPGVLLCFEATLPVSATGLLPMRSSVDARWEIGAVSGE